MPSSVASTRSPVGVPVSGGNALKTAPRTAWSEKLQKRIPAVYREGELTVAEIADRFGLTVRTTVRYLDASVRSRREHDIAILHRRDVGRLEIARQLGLTPDTVSDYLRQLAFGGEIESAACPHCGR